MMEEIKRPIKEANRITKLLDLSLESCDRYPVNVERVALELTPAFNSDPITAVQAGSMGKIDGMLAKHPKKDEWAIFYNQDVTHSGRTNFTLAHELGHYVVHRHDRASGRFECGENEILGEDQKHSYIETEANEFAANLLMPNHDFRSQIEGEPFTFDLIQHCANRYGVSLTAASLKWLNFSKKGAIILLSEDGFMHWSKSNDRAFRSGKYFATKKKCIEVPDLSLASQTHYSSDAKNGFRHKSGIWFPNDEVTEFSIYSTEHKKTLTVLILDDVDGSYVESFDEDSELLVDISTKISKNFS